MSQISTKFLPCSVNFRMASTKFLSRCLNLNADIDFVSFSQCRPQNADTDWVSFSQFRPPNSDFDWQGGDLRMMTSTEFLGVQNSEWYIHRLRISCRADLKMLHISRRADFRKLTEASESPGVILYSGSAHLRIMLTLTMIISGSADLQPDLAWASRGIKR
jgi:hypothetical protein